MTGESCGDGKDPGEFQAEGRPTAGQPEDQRRSGLPEGAELVISATPSFAVRRPGKKIAPYLTPETVLVSVSKGIERDTNLRMSQILTEVTGNICKVAALSGPSSRRGSKHSDAHRLRVRLPGSESGPAGTGRFHE